MLSHWLFLAVAINARYTIPEMLPSGATEAVTELSAPSAHYLPCLERGQRLRIIIKGLTRFGNLIVDPTGKAITVRYHGEEQVIYILDGTGFLTVQKKIYLRKE